jgi:hypothetical protein
MEEIFIRHKLGKERKYILRDLWSKKRIAVHFKNISSTNPKDYEFAGRLALTRLQNCCNTGSIVAAAYRDLDKARMLIGIIKKGAKIETVKYGNLKLKTVQLHKVKIISYNKFPLLAAIQPRQGTITGWPSAKTHLESILKHNKLSFSVDSIAPEYLEILCYEYLRYKHYIDLLLLPIGRTLQDIDIRGISKKKENVIAQVTYRRTDINAINNKIKHLKKYKSTNTKLFYFGPKDNQIKEKEVIFIPIETVFAELIKKSKYKYLIRKMLYSAD